jgi:hypothetical protein
LDDAHSESRVIELLKENVALDKVLLQYNLIHVVAAHSLSSQRLTQAMIDNEIAEASNKRAMEELEEARDSISRLTAHQARSVGLESRLNAVNQEMGDMKQERDSQAQRAKVAELRIVALNEKLSKSISQERHLQR